MDRETQTGFSIGIGVTTTPNRKEYVDRWLLEFEKVKPKNYHLHIHEDVHYRGVAYSKNQNLKTLKDCDYIFLFDSINTHQRHLVYENRDFYFVKIADTYGPKRISSAYESDASFW
jgi:hypothetical protein